MGTGKRDSKDRGLSLRGSFIMLNHNNESQTSEEFSEIESLLSRSGREYQGGPDHGFETRIAAGAKLTVPKLTLTHTGDTRLSWTLPSRWVPFAAAAALLAGVFTYVVAISAPSTGPSGPTKIATLGNGTSTVPSNALSESLDATDEYVLALAGLSERETAVTSNNATEAEFNPLELLSEVDRGEV